MGKQVGEGLLDKFFYDIGIESGCPSIHETTNTMLETPSKRIRFSAETKRDYEWEKELRHKRHQNAIESLHRLCNIKLLCYPHDCRKVGQYETVQNVRVVFDSVCRKSDYSRVVTCDMVWKDFVSVKQYENIFQFVPLYLCKSCKKMWKKGCCVDYSKGNRIRKEVVMKFHLPQELRDSFCNQNKSYPVDNWFSGISPIIYV